MLSFHERAHDRLSEIARDLPEGEELAEGRHRKHRTAEDRLHLHRLTAEPPRKDRVGRWRTQMSVEDRAAFESEAGDLLVELGYEVGNTEVVAREAEAPCFTSRRSTGRTTAGSTSSSPTWSGTLPQPYRTYAFLNKLPKDHSDKFSYSSDERIKDHATKLNILGDLIEAHADDEADPVLFVDGDAFPIASMAPAIESLSSRPSR